MITSRRAIRTIVTLVLASLPALAGTSDAGGKFLYVDTSGNDMNDCLSRLHPCQTIQAAVDKAADNDTILVSPGTYAEQVTINTREGLEIRGDPSARLVAPATPAGPNVVSIYSSRKIFIRRLTVAGPGMNASAATVTGIAINISTVTLADSTVEDAKGGGVILFNDSFLHVANSAIRHNGSGIRIDGGSSARIGSENPAESVVIEDNSYVGVMAGLPGGSVLLRGSVIIQRNSVGILGAGMTVSTCCSEDRLPLKVLNNATGIRMEGGHLELRVPAVVEGNSLLGIRLVGSTAFFGRYGGGTGDRITIRNNGADDNGATGAVFLTGSHADLVITDIVDNRSRGVLAQDNSSLRVSDAVIARNGAEGVRLESSSTVRLFTALLGDNSGFDLSCTPESVGAGDSTGVKRMFCPAFDKASRPVPGGPHRD